MSYQPNDRDVALYRNAKGQLVTHGSYSARETYRYCPRKFQLSRVDGWREKENRASALFGKCIEAGIQAFEEGARMPGTGVERFKTLWNNVGAAKDADELVYTDCEGSWVGLLRAGCEMQRLYEIHVPRLPISVKPRPRFQVQLRKKIFPGTPFDILENTAYLDILSYPQWDHPALPRIEPGGTITTAEMAGVRPLIIDCKTAGGDLATDLISLDPQLVEYAWQARIPDVAFLWFVKRSHKLERKNRVSLLESIDGVAAGTELLVLGFEQPPKEGIVPPLHVYLGDESAQRSLEDATKGLNHNTNLYKERCAAFFQARFVVGCYPNQITKQRLQFAAVRLDEQAIDEAGQAVGRDTVEMIRAHNEGFYPRTGGVRFPNNKCTFCSMRGICADKPILRDAMLYRSGEEWMEREVD